MIETENKTNENGYFYNILPITIENHEIKVAFSPTPLRDGVCIGYASVPEDVKTFFFRQTAVNTNKLNRFYLRFDPSPTYKGVVCLVELMKHPVIARYYLLYRLYNVFRQQNHYLQTNFVRDLIVWVPQSKTEYYASFSRMQLKVKFYSPVEMPSLVISYIGEANILLQSLGQMDKSRPEASVAIGKVIYKKMIYNSFDQLPDDAHDARHMVFPILNKKLERLLSISVPLRRVTKKHQLHWQRVEQFYADHFSTIQKAGVRLSQQWLPAVPAFKLTGSSTKLLFGQGKAHTDIFTGLKNYGPYKPLRVRQLVCFFIYTSAFAKAKIRLQRELLGTDENKGLKVFLKLSVFHDENMDIVLESNNYMPEQLSRQISQLSLDPSLAYLAIYISPFDKNTGQEHQNKVYYHIKEVLLQRNIASQTVVGSKVLDTSTNLQYWIPNVAMAVIAKLGGIPWVLDKIHLPSLVVGFGIYRSRQYDLQYEGSSFTFGDNGQFRGFEYYPAGSAGVLAARMEEALTTFLQKHGLPEHLILHYYKTLSKYEFAPLQKMLREFKPGMPVFVVKVNAKGTEDFLVKDLSDPYGLPRDGHVFKLGANDYLLYVNGYTGDGRPSGQPLPIRCYLQSNIVGRLEDEATVGMLLQQVYDFSRLYWRSVLQPPMPVTVEYPRLLAMQTAWFDGNSLPGSLSDLPWFL